MNSIDIAGAHGQTCIYKKKITVQNILDDAELALLGISELILLFLIIDIPFNYKSGHMSQIPKFFLVEK